MQILPRPVTLLSSATLPDGRQVDVMIDGPTVVDVVPAGEGHAPEEETLDLTGYLLLTAGCDPHAHLDKAYSWDAINPPMGDLEKAIESFHAYQENITVEDILARARRAALRLLANGTTAVRSHINILPGPDPLRGVIALTRLREELAGLMDLELVTLGADDIPTATLEQAIDAGVDLLGGVPHLAEDPHAELRRLVELAERLGVSIDLHTDEALHGEPTLGEFAVLVRDWPEGQHATAGHCVRLGTLPIAQRDAIIDEVLASDVGIATLPITNLYLQGWDEDVATPRGLTALRSLIERGARLGAGADNVRDPFNPLGRSDPLETAMLLVTAGHLTVDEAWELSSSGSRRVMRLPEAGALPGARAEFLAIRATNLYEAVAEAPADRIVIHHGAVVAESRLSQRLAHPLSSTAPEGK